MLTFPHATNCHNGYICMLFFPFTITRPRYHHLTVDCWEEICTMSNPGSKSYSWSVKSGFCVSALLYLERIKLVLLIIFILELYDRQCWQRQLQLSARQHFSTFQHHQLSVNGEVWSRLSVFCTSQFQLIFHYWMLAIMQEEWYQFQETLLKPIASILDQMLHLNLKLSPYHLQNKTEPPSESSEILHKRLKSNLEHTKPLGINIIGFTEHWKIGIIYVCYWTLTGIWNPQKWWSVPWGRKWG